MQKLSSIFVLFASIFSDSAAYAATNLAASEIQRIATGWAQEGIYFVLEQPTEAEGCSKTAVVLENDHQYFDQILSIVLAAMHSKQKVIFRVEGCTGNDHLALKAVQVDF